MSLKLNSSGGGSITLQEPSTASNRTLTLPDNTGTVVSTASTGVVSQAMLASGVAGNGPAFSAWASTATNTPTSTWAKIVFASEEFDTANCFDNVSTYRFTPNVAGYYQINGSVYANAYASQLVSIWKNGAEWKRGVQNNAVNTVNLNVVSAIVYLNGSTDYVELYWFQGSGSTVNSLTGQVYTYFQGFLARAA